jgi:hypothetical protein
MLHKGLPKWDVLQGTFPFLKILSETVASNDLRDVIVIGGSSARLAAGFYEGRDLQRIALVERRGGWGTFARRNPDRQ